jgi:phage gp45-like
MTMRYRNGTIAPSGIFSTNASRAITAFNKTNKNYAIRAGIVVKRYEIKDRRNVSKLAVEYDVMVIEQDGNLGTAPIMYRNCLSTDGLGGIGDYFEKKLRRQKNVKTGTRGIEAVGQDGSVVLLMCLDGAGEKGIIVGSLKHPDRKTKLVGKDEILAGEYNGVEILVNEDGSCSLTFKGATDNEGKPKDKSQGNTSLKIEKDGSLEIKNKGVTQRNQKDGKFSLAAEGSASISAKKEISISSNDKINIKAQSDALLECQKLAIKASGSATFEVQSFKLQSQGEAVLKAQMISLEGQSAVKVKASSITLDGRVSLGGSGGTPAVTLKTKFFGIGAMGVPVTSSAIGPFSLKVTLT